MEVYDYSTLTRDQLLAEVYRLNLLIALDNWRYAKTAEAKALHKQESEAWKKKHEEQLQKNRESH
jgi:hypothetical protein